MICKDCEKHGEALKKSMTRAECIFILTSSVMMMRSIKGSPNERQDAAVANSVITKALLSFDLPTRGSFIQYLQESLQMRITLDSCPHGALVVV